MGHDLEKSCLEEISSCGSTEICPGKIDLTACALQIEHAQGIKIHCLCYCEWVLRRSPRPRSQPQEIDVHGSGGHWPCGLFGLSGLNLQ